MLKSVVTVAAVFCMALQIGCRSVEQDEPDKVAVTDEQVLEKAMDQAVAEEKHLDRRAWRKLNEILVKSEEVDAENGGAVLEVVEQLEEVQADFIAVSPELQQEFVEALREWCEAYLRLGQRHYEEAMRAAAGRVALGDFKGAVAEMDKFPEVLGRRGPYGELAEKRKKAIEALSQAPKDILDTLSEADRLLGEGKHEKALERLDSYFKTVTAKEKSAAIELLIDKHTSILDTILSRFIDKGEYDKALECIARWKELYVTPAHTMFLIRKRISIEEQQSAESK